MISPIGSNSDTLKTLVMYGDFAREGKVMVKEGTHVTTETKCTTDCKASAHPGLNLAVQNEEIVYVGCSMSRLVLHQQANETRLRPHQKPK